MRLQVRTGVESHRARFGEGWRGGFWLPECAHAPWLHAPLEEAGVHATCVDLTDVLGPGDPRHLRPLATEAGPLLVPIDRAAVDLVWARRRLPVAHAAYRDHHHRTARDHHPWANDGAVYDPARAAEQAAADAADFVARVAARVDGGGLCVCALDTELLGVWWHEGPRWLALVVDAGARARASSSCTSTTRWPTATRRPPATAAATVTTWGTPRDLSTWSAPAGRRPGLERPRAPSSRSSPPAPAVGDRARARAAGAPEQRLGLPRPRPGRRASTRASASTGHARELRAALRDPGAEPALRNLAPRLARAALLEP